VSRAGPELLARLRQARVLPVLRTPAGGSPLPTVDLLVDEGQEIVELTMTSPHPYADLRAASRHHPGILFGLGSVTEPAQVEAAAAAGAVFVVTPVADPATIETALRLGLAAVGGAFTPTEALTMSGAGATAVKIYPAGRLGPSYLADLLGPMPGLPLLPTGALRISEAGEYLAAGAVAVGLGSNLVGDSCAAGGDLEGLRDRYRRLREAVGLVARSAP
jgi:2-dehydro-3-deoxyphosphogluconate aldolase / (4S)-4-hydroxy-2-oxoglutarate aldolase